MYLSCRSRYSSSINQFERIISLDESPASIRPSELEPGDRISFVYRPLLWRAEREFMGDVVTKGKGSVVVRVEQECPVPFRFGFGPCVKRFWFSKMDIYSVDDSVIGNGPNPIKPLYSNPDGISQDWRLRDTPAYRDEHGDR